MLKPMKLKSISKNINLQMELIGCNLRVLIIDYELKHH